LRNLLSDNIISSATSKTIFIGIGLTGKKKLRSRDFIPPIKNKNNITKSNRKDYGQADAFYNFLTLEIIPMIDHHFRVNNSRTLIGHFLGGLFVFYCLLSKEHWFKNYIALSPALWVNRFNIFKYEQQYHSKTDSMNVYLYLSAGAREVFNLILIGTKRMKNVLKQRKYNGLRFDYFEHRGKRHFDQIPVSLSYILKHTNF
jgi:predicted alpha/beta superfamily hydrolase